MQGDVACDIKVICRHAKKPFVVDEFKMEELVATGQATTEEVAAMLRARHIKVFAATPATIGGADVSLLRWWREYRPAVGGR